jgi:hypothetical protein
MKRIITFLLFSPLLISCVPSTLIETVQPTQPSFVVTPTSSPIATLTIASTQTLMPEIATANAVESICSHGTSSVFNSNRDVSWNNQWFAVTCNGTPNVLKVARSDKSVVWSVPAQDVVFDNTAYPTSYEVYRWSHDNNFLYFVPSYYRGDPAYFLTEPGLLRLELSTGKVEAILEPFESFAYSLSPSDNFLAYSTFGQDDEVFIHDMVSNTTSSIKLPKHYVDLGYFEWTIDSHSFVFAAGIDGWIDNRLGLSLYLYDNVEHSLTTLVDDDKRAFVPSGDRYDPNYGPLGGRYWLDKDRLVLLSLADESQWEIDIRTRKLVISSKSNMIPTPESK